MSIALTHAAEVQQSGENGRISLERNHKRIRVFFAGHVIADTTRAVYLFEKGHLPVYYIPRDDVRTDSLEPLDATTWCPWKGKARYWDLVVDDRRAERSLWGYDEPLKDSLDLSWYVAFYWHKMDAWYEEDQQVFVHPRDPYVRVDVLPSSRHVEVFIGDTLVADTTHPRLLFETSLPVRYYIPRIDVRSEFFTGSDAKTSCPYKARPRTCRSPDRTTATPSRTPPGTTRSRPRRLRASATTCRSTPTAPGSSSTAPRWRLSDASVNFVP